MLGAAMLRFRSIRHNLQFPTVCRTFIKGSQGCRPLQQNPAEQRNGDDGTKGGQHQPRRCHFCIGIVLCCQDNRHSSPGQSTGEDKQLAGKLRTGEKTDDGRQQTRKCHQLNRRHNSQIFVSKHFSQRLQGNGSPHCDHTQGNAGVPQCGQVIHHRHRKLCV